MLARLSGNPSDPGFIPRILDFWGQKPANGF